MSGGELVVQDRGGGDVKRFELRSGVVTLGAHPDCDIRVLLPHVLDHHATVAVHARQTLIRDLSNGSTLVNGSAVSVHALQHGDVITVGDRSMRWEYTRPATVSKMTPRPALAMKSVRKRGRPARVSEISTRRMDPDIHLALEMKHRASMPGGTKQVAIVQPRRRDAVGDIVETKARLITKPHRPHPNSIRRTPKKSPEPSTSQIFNNSSRKRTPRKSPKLNLLHSETKASQWIASRKTPKRSVNSFDIATPKNVVYVHVATPRPVNPYVEKSPSKMLASNSPKKVLAKKATPLRQVVLRKAVTPKVTPASKMVSPRKSRGTPKNKVEKIQAPLVMDEKKKAALMMITRTPQSKLMATKSAIPVLVKKTNTVIVPKATLTTVPKAKATKSPNPIAVAMSPKNLSMASNRISRGRKRQSPNQSADSFLDSTDSEVSQTRSTRSNISLPDAVSPLPPSPHKSALKNPLSKKKHNKTESIKFDLSNLDVGNDTSDLLFITNDDSEEEMTLQYSDISPKSSPKRSLNSRSSRILEKSLGKMPSFSSKASVYTPQSPNRSKSGRSSLILQNAYGNQSPSTSRRSNANMETYSIVDLVSLDSNGSNPSLYSSADSTSTSNIVFGTPNERHVLSRSRGKSSIAPNLVSSSTPFIQNNPRASRSKENLSTSQKISFSIPEFNTNKENKRSKSLSTPIRSENSYIINSSVAQSDMDDSRFVEASTFSRNNSSITLFGDATTSPKLTKRSRNTTNSPHASLATSPRTSRNQQNITDDTNATITKSPRRSRSQEHISDDINSTITKSYRKSSTQENISNVTNATITNSPRKSRSQGNISDNTNGSLTKSSRRSRSQGNISDITNMSIKTSPRKSRSQDNINDITNESIIKSSRKSRNLGNISDITTNPRESRSQGNISNITNASVNSNQRGSRSQGNISNITNVSITTNPRESRSHGNVGDIMNASLTKGSRKSRNQNNISDFINATITVSPRNNKSKSNVSDIANVTKRKSPGRSRSLLNISDVSNASTNPRKSRSQANINNVTNTSLTKSSRLSRSQQDISDITNASIMSSPRKSRSQLNISDVTNTAATTNLRKSRSKGNISNVSKTSITKSSRQSRSQDNIKTNEITPNLSSRRSKSHGAGRGSSKKNTPNFNNDGQITPENQTISPQEAGTPVLHMEDLLVSHRPFSNRKLGRKTINIITKNFSPIQRGVNTDPKKRGRGSRINFKSAKKLLLRRQSNDSGDSNKTNEKAPKPTTDDKCTPKSSIKLIPEEVKQKHSTAKKTKSKRSIIDNLDDSDIVKQLFNSPVKRKLSQSMTEFNRSLNLEKKTNNKRTRRTIAVFNLTPDQSYVEDNIETPNVTVENFVSPLNKTTNTPNLEGIKRLFKKDSPKNDLTNIKGVKSLLRTPRTRKSPKNDLSNVSGVKDVFKGRTPRNDLTNVRGVKQVFASSPKNDLRRVSGVKALFQSQKKPKPVRNVSNISRGKKVLQVKSPKNDLRDVRGVKQIFRQNRSQTGLIDLSGVEELFTEAHTSNSENLFDQFVGKPVLKKTYSKSFIAKKPSKSNPQAFTSLLPVDAISNNVEEWLDEEINRRLQKDSLIIKGTSKSRTSKILSKSKSKNMSLNKSKSGRELQRLVTDTINGSEPLQTSRNRSQLSNSNIEKSLPLKKRSLVNIVNISEAERKMLPIKKRVIVHSTPVKANRTLLETTEMGRVSPIAVTDTTDTEAVIVRSPVQHKRQTKDKVNVTPKKRSHKSKPIPTSAIKTPPKPSPRKTRTSKAIPKPSPTKTKVKRRRSSLVVTKKAPIMSPKKTGSLPKQTRKTNKKIQETPKKESPIKKRVGRSTRAAITTSPGRRNAAKKATAIKKADTPKKETPKTKRGRAKTVIEATISPKPRSTRAKPKPITPKANKTKNVKKVIEPAVVITKVTPKFSPEVKKTRNARQTKPKEVEIVLPLNRKRGGKVEVIEEPRGRKRKTVDSPKVATPKPKRNAKVTKEILETNKDKSIEKKTRGKKAKQEEVPKKVQKSEELVKRSRRGNPKVVEVEAKKPAKKTTTKPAVEAKPSSRKRKADTPPPVAEPPQRRARGKKVEPEPVRITRGKPQVTTSTRTARSRK